MKFALRAAIGDTHSGGDIGDRDSNFVGIDIEDASQRPAWYREADCYRNGFRINENNWNSIISYDCLDLI